MPVSYLGFVPFVILFASVAGSLQSTVVHIVRAAVGPGGAPSGDRFVLDQERATFRKGADKQIVVVFEWDGRPGRHRLGGTWTHVESSSSSSSQLDHEARQRRFGAYWVFPLLETTPIGHWTFQATVDGEPAGLIDFTVVDVSSSEQPPARGGSRVLSQSELYERLAASTVVLLRSTRRTVVGPAAGVALSEARVLMPLSVMDGVPKSTMLLPGGSRVEVVRLAGWNRHQDWAVVSGLPQLPALPMARTDPSVGDRCYSIGAAPDGALVLVEGTVVGQQSGETPHFMASFFTGVPSPGAPVANDAGELTGMIVGRPALEIRGSLDVVRLQGDTLGTAALAVRDLQLVEVPEPVEMGELARRGVLLLPLEHDQNVLSGGFAPRVRKDGAATQPIDQRFEFFAAEKTMFVFATWIAQERVKAKATARMYDEENRTVVESAPLKLDLRPGRTIWTDWKVTVPSRRGVYRVDLLLDGVPAWRGYFRVSQ